MRPRICKTLGAGLWILAALPSMADGIFTLDSQATYQQAINSGQLVPVTAWDSAMEFLFSGASADFRASSLSTDINGLVISFVDDLATVDFGDDYIYGADPDLTGKKFDKTVVIPLVPGAVASVVGIVLTDTNGNHKAWSINGPPAGTVQLDLAADGGQQGTAGYKVDPGFDISKVTQIADGFSYQFPAPPPPPQQKGVIHEGDESVGTKLPEPATGLLIAPILLIILYGTNRRLAQTCR